jgi:protein SCO1/2
LTTTAAQPPSASIYPLQVTLRDQNDALIGADVFRGHPVIVTMFYGSCPAACPLLVSHIKQIESALAAGVREQTRVLIVSFDAERDTPAALQQLARAHRVDASRWRFASGPDDEARLLANALGVSYRKGEEGVFSHNSVISVLDGEGRIVARSDDPKAELVPLGAAVTRLGTL